MIDADKILSGYEGDLSIHRQLGDRIAFLDKDSDCLTIVWKDDRGFWKITDVDDHNIDLIGDRGLPELIRLGYGDGPYASEDELLEAMND